jgi:cobalt-zinc-cadmium efflux system protein
LRVVGPRPPPAYSGRVGAGHTHATVTGGHRRRLLLVLLITGAVLVMQVIGALISGSLALLADAGHMLTDVAGVGMSLLAATLASRPPTLARTYGWQRAEILAAMANGMLLFGVAALVLIEAVRRLSEPPEVSTGVMLVVAVLGLGANLVALRLLHRGKSESLNVRGAYLEVFGDMLGSAAVVLAAAILALTEWWLVDPLASIVVALLILPRTWLLLRDALDVLLEATPRGVALAEVRRHILEVPGVHDVHDLHAWTITSGMPVLSAHVVVDESVIATGCGPSILDHLQRCLAGHFDVEHSTFQLEPAGHRDHEGSAHE